MFLQVLQNINSCADIFVKNKYFEYLKANNIELISNIYERMDLDRRIKDKMAEMAKNQSVTQESLNKTKKKLKKMINKKLTSFLYSPGKKQQISKGVHNRKDQKEYPLELIDEDTVKPEKEQSDGEDPSYMKKLTFG